MPQVGNPDAENPELKEEDTRSEEDTVMNDSEKEFVQPGTETELKTGLIDKDSEYTGEQNLAIPPSPEHLSESESEAHTESTEEDAVGNGVGGDGGESIPTCEDVITSLVSEALGRAPWDVDESGAGAPEKQAIETAGSDAPGLEQEGDGDEEDTQETTPHNRKRRLEESVSDGADQPPRKRKKHDAVANKPGDAMDVDDDNEDAEAKQSGDAMELDEKEMIHNDEEKMEVEIVSGDESTSATVANVALIIPDDFRVEGMFYWHIRADILEIPQVNKNWIKTTGVGGWKDTLPP
jgi:hypothetical protein